MAYDVGSSRSMVLFFILSIICFQWKAIAGCLIAGFVAAPSLYGPIRRDGTIALLRVMGANDLWCIMWVAQEI